jgi:hypothetical protein
LIGFSSWFILYSASFACVPDVLPAFLWQKLRMNKNALILVLCSIVSVLHAQNIVSGRVLDHHGAPLPFARVVMRFASDSTRMWHQPSNEKGLFEINGLPSSVYALEVHYLGYDVLQRTIEVTGSPANLELLDLILMENSALLGEVQVVAQRSLVEQQADRTVVNVSQLTGAAGGSAIDMLGQMPGVQIDRLNDRIVMNGKNGVIVAVNGKPTRMDDMALQQWLQSMPAANIERIELIHTPPASYEAAGNAGVINIVLRTQTSLGWNGQASVYGGYGQFEKFGGSTALFFNRERLRFFANVDLNGNRTREDAIIETRTADAVTGLYSKRPTLKGLQNVRAGLDFDASKYTTLSLSVSGYFNSWQMKATTDSDIRDAQGNLLSRSVLTAQETNNWHHAMVSAGMQQQLGKGSLNVDADYLYYYDHNPTDYRNLGFDGNGQQIKDEVFISRKKTPIHVQVYKADYKLPLSGGLQLEAGVKSTFYRFVNKVSVWDMVQGVQQRNELFSSELTLTEGIGAGYVGADWQANKQLQLTGGIRFEQTLTNLLDGEGNRLRRLEYGRFFPTASLAYRFNTATQWQLSYNERINRPPFYWMAPAFFFFSPTMILGGNPGLLPSFSKQFTTSVKHKGWLFTVQASTEKHAMIVLPSTTLLENYWVVRAENMHDSKTAMFSIQHHGGYKKWMSQVQIALYGQQLYVQYDNANTRLRNWYVQASTTQSVQLPRGFSVELTNQTTTAQYFGLSRIPFNTTFSLGVQKKIGAQHHITCHWFDIFDSGTFWANNLEQPGYAYRFDYNFEGSVLKLTYRYDFGRKLDKTSGNRKSASDDERRRFQ